MSYGNSATLKPSPVGRILLPYYDTKVDNCEWIPPHLINYALERGYSYRQWQTIANTMLFKDPGSFKIHRTRVIHIYEADFNLILGPLPIGSLEAT